MAFTYRDPYLSLWQSAAREVEQRRSSVRSKLSAASLTTAPIPALPDLMDPAHRVGLLALDQKSIAPGETFSLGATAEGRNLALPGGAAALVDCAKIAAQFLWAEITRNHAKADLLADELKNSVCDPGWAECLTTYLAFKASGESYPYRANVNAVTDLGAKTKLAILGDWGTGDAIAINLLQQVKALGPDVVIHLGDVYYAGTQDEQRENFLDICRSVLGASIPLYSLCGNHDMYSGGDGYYWLVDQIGQQASYFCLQNPSWQFLAMDTGHNDIAPLSVGSNMTSLSSTEPQWHLNKIQNAGGRKTILLSHHQLFSAFGSVGSVNGTPYAYNPNLFADFQSVLGQIEWWFWGHEHTLAVYDPYMTLRRGRCVGCSAVPVFTHQQSYTTAQDLQTYAGAPMPTWNGSAIVGNNGTDYDNAFAMITLTGPAATVDYYQVPPLRAAVKVSSE